MECREVSAVVPRELKIGLILPQTGIMGQGSQRAEIEVPIDRYEFILVIPLKGISHYYKYGNCSTLFNMISVRS